VCAGESVNTHFLIIKIKEQNNAAHYNENYQKHVQYITTTGTGTGYNGIAAVTAGNPP